jgi:hypothetical protein
MNRRGFLGALSGFGAVAAVATPKAEPERLIEPIPTRWDFETVERPSKGLDCDVTVMTVSWALQTLEWTSDEPWKPLLCVPPMKYAEACYIKDRLNDAIEIYATSKIVDHDAWFVALHGRRVGSVGA